MARSNYLRTYIQEEVSKVEIIIREDIEVYMRELTQWLLETKDVPLEEMGAFFSARMDSYEEHMSVWKPAYEALARLIPSGCQTLLDLGCGTGLELEEIFKLHPHLKVTGVDLCRDMLDQLRIKWNGTEESGAKGLSVVCQDYFEYDMGENRWDAVISFESFHHFFQVKKTLLYHKIYRSLVPGGAFVLGDYIACCDEEEKLLQKSYLEKREKYRIPEKQFVHFDIPLTLEHELEALRAAGFAEVEAVDSIEGATLITAKK